MISRHVSTQRERAISLIAYALILSILHYKFIEQSFLPTAKAIWFYSGMAGLLFGSRLLNPFFVSPSDAATNGSLGLIAVLGACLAVFSGSSPPIVTDVVVIAISGAFYAALLVAAVVVILLGPSSGERRGPWFSALLDSVRQIGKPNPTYTGVILVAVWLFHRNEPRETIVILAAWTSIVALEPVEGLLRLFKRWKSARAVEFEKYMIGEVAGYQSPGMCVIRQFEDQDKHIFIGTPLIIAGATNRPRLAVAINYVGHDSGDLLRASFVHTPNALKHDAEEQFRALDDGNVALLSAPAEHIKAIEDSPGAYLLTRPQSLCGIVDEGTTTQHLHFEVVADTGLQEGRLVEAELGGNSVLYQIIEGVTREDALRQKNTYGYARAKARKIGKWDSDNKKFVPVNWLPTINSPVFLKEPTEFQPTVDVIGHFPMTSYTASIDISDAVTHNTAILGILGIGKSYLAVELVERMIAAGIKVLCLDLTEQYERLLPEFLDAAFEKSKLDELNAAGGFGGVSKNVEQGGSKVKFREKIIEQLREFVSPSDSHFLRIYNPAKFDVWRQDSKPYEGKASMASLTPCEITSIFVESALIVAQELGMTDTARLCVVLEEAHSLVPEWNSVAADGDKVATAASARAILQGRKYGVGCLLITQRTANVTKTILNQCNSIFAMRTFDDTGKDFLANYIGSEYSSVLPTLQERCAVFFGKASNCENPILIRLNDREQFLGTFRAAHPPPPLPAFSGSPQKGTQTEKPDPPPSVAGKVYKADTDWNPYED